MCVEEYLVHTIVAKGMQSFKAYFQYRQEKAQLKQFAAGIYSNSLQKKSVKGLIMWCI